MKVEQKYLIGNESVILHLEIKGKIKIYLSENDRVAFITDFASGDVLASVTADCAQNSAYLSVDTFKF